jgi:hypothetical protein
MRRRHRTARAAAPEAARIGQVPLEHPGETTLASTGNARFALKDAEESTK